MPAARPRASFEPIPPDFDVSTFVDESDNFQYVDRISYEMVEANGIEQFEKLVLLHVIIGGKPLVIDGFEEILDPYVFTPSWLQHNCGDKVENARNLTTKEDLPLTIRHYLKHLGKLTNQFFDNSERNQDKPQQRIYLKDIDCPEPWQEKMKEYIPLGFYYLNESTGLPGGPGALEEMGGRRGRGIARAGDLMSSLPPEMRADNLMCYIGHEGTYTPAHREMCASLGQNLMVSASSSQAGDDGQMEHPGSSLWFMTETKDRHLVSEYWLSVLGHDIEVEKHFAQLIAWKKAPFKTYVVEQRPGDFILIPPLAPHQVWNRGTYTMKIAWNRTTVETLEMAFSEALPNSRIVCRDEQYKNKAIVYFTLLKYSSLIRLSRGQVERGSAQAENIRRSTKVRQVQRDFKRLFNLYTQILLSEMLAPVSRTHVDFLPYDSNVTCAYCRCNIFNRFLTCKSCKNMFGSDIEEPYDICMDCYCMGRSCGCQSGYTWVEQWKWKDLVDRYEEWRALIIEIERYNAETAPLSLQEEREYLGKKTLAQVCQEQLELRPFVDIKNPPRENKNVSDDEEIEVDDDGKVKKTAKKRKSKRWLAQHKSCHFCLHRHPIWKMAFCTSCDLAYCYGSLFRAHDMMPLTIMEDPHWKCPHCRKVCNTGACRRNPNQHPYEPKGTLLGHDTRKVADVRSVECLIDFSKSNLNWLREDDGSGPSVLQRRHQEAEKAKMADPSLDARYLDEDQYDDPKDITYSPMEDSNGGVYDMGLHDTGGPGFINPALMRDPSYDPFYNNIARDPSLGNVGEKRTWSDSDDQMDNGGRRSKGAPKKRKKNDARMPKNLLEQAQKDDRFILLAAKMKGRSKVVKLPLRPELLEQIQRRPVSVNLQNLAQQALEQDDFGDRQPNLQPTTSLIAPTASVARSTNTILQSDVLHHARSASASGRKEKPGRPPKDQTAALPVGLPDGENDVDDVQPVAHINFVDIESPIDGKRRSGRLPKDRTAALPVGPPTKEVDEVNDTQRTDHTTSNNVGPKSPMGRKRRPGRPPKDQTVALPIGLPIDEPDEIDSTQPTDFNSPHNMGTETPTGSEKRPGGPPKDRVTFSVSSIKNPSIRSRNHEAGEAVNPHEDEESNAKVHSGNSNSPHLVSVSSIGKRRPGRPPKDRKAAFPIGLPNDEQDEHSSAQPAVDYNSSRDIHNGDSIGKKKKPGRHPKDRKTVLPVGLPADGTDESGNEELVLGQNNSPNMGSHGAIGKRRSGRPPKDRKIDLPVGLLNDGFRNAPPASENTDSPLAATGSVMSRKRKPGRPSKIRARALSIEPADESNHVQSIPGHEAWKKRINGRKDEGNATLPLDAKNDDIGDQHLASPSKSLSGAGPAGVVRKKKISKGQQKEGKWALPVNDHNEQDFYDEPNRAYMPTLPAASATPEVPMTEEEKRLQENLRVKIALYEEFDDHDPVFNGFIGRLAAEDEPLVHEAH